MAKTIAEKLATVLLAQGYKELESRTRKYRTFQKEGESEKLFVGKSGALRKGTNSSSSLSITGGQLYRHLLADYQASLNPVK
jgi:hypothetical protein